MDKITPRLSHLLAGQVAGQNQTRWYQESLDGISKKNSTGYKGVFYVERQGEKILCIFYRKLGDRKQYEEKLGTSAQGWTPARANAEHTCRINGQELTNNERRQAPAKAKRDVESRLTIERLWDLYLESKGG